MFLILIFDDGWLDTPLAELGPVSAAVRDVVVLDAIRAVAARHGGGADRARD